MNTSFYNVMDHVGIYYKFNSSLKLLFLYLQLGKHTYAKNKRAEKMMNSNQQHKIKSNHDYIVDYYMTKKYK